MSHLTRRHCETCGKYYEGRGKFYCSNMCCKKSSIYQASRGEKLRGRSTWNKGIHQKTNDSLEEWRKSGGVPWNKGIYIRLSPATEFKKGQTTGSDNPNWKGGIGWETNSARKTDEYNRWRQSVYSRDGWKCQHCGIKCQAKNIVAHHIYYFSEVPELRHQLGDGVTLCRSCHFKLHLNNKTVDKLFYEAVLRPENYDFIIGKSL